MSNIIFSKKEIKFLLFSIFLIFNISCSSNNNSKTSNQAFLEQYGGGLTDIKRRIADNKINAEQNIVGQYNTINSLNIKGERYGNYNFNAKIFFPVYLDYNFPNQYPIKIVNFNDIAIPKKDNFNIKTRMEKSYPILDYKYLQSNIRQINKDEK